jgi:hypothetical protein
VSDETLDAIAGFAPRGGEAGRWLLMQKGDSDVVQGGIEMGGVPQTDVTTILRERYITALVQAALDPPVRAHQFAEPVCIVTP